MGADGIVWLGGVSVDVGQSVACRPRRGAEDTHSHGDFGCLYSDIEKNNWIGFKTVAAFFCISSAVLNVTFLTGSAACTAFFRGMCCFLLMQFRHRRMYSDTRNEKQVYHSSF